MDKISKTPVLGRLFFSLPSTQTPDAVLPYVAPSPTTTAPNPYNQEHKKRIQLPHLGYVGIKLHATGQSISIQ